MSGGRARPRPRWQLPLLHERTGVAERSQGDGAVHPRCRRAASAAARHLREQGLSVVPSRGAAKSPLTIAGLRWYICALLFLVTFINYVDRVSLGALAPLL